MTPERWSRLGDLFEAALQRQRQDRSAFLEQACAGDDELRTEVASLIEAYESARGFLIRPAMPGASLILRETLEQGDGSPKFALLLGITVGNRYRIEALIGHGGQALVFRGRDLMLMSKPVVVKVPSTAERSTPPCERATDEFEALTLVNHPGVVRALDKGTLPGGLSFLVLEYVEGITLRQALGSGPLQALRAAAILRQIGAALDAVHAAGVAHCDLKPENVMLQPLSDGSEQVKLIDFGIAKLARPEYAGAINRSIVAGSLRYMAPEQFQGEKTRASDVYAVGLLACEMLCGHPDVRVLRAHRRVRRLVRVALACRPQARPASAGDYCNRLADALLGPRRMTVWGDRRRPSPLPL